MDETPSLSVRLGWWLKDLSQRVRVHALQRVLQRNFPSWQLVPASKGFHRLHKLAYDLPALLQAAEFCTLRLKAKPLEDELKDLPTLEELVPQIARTLHKISGACSPSACPASCSLDWSAAGSKSGGTGFFTISAARSGPTHLCTGRPRGCTSGA